MNEAVRNGKIIGYRVTPIDAQGNAYSGYDRNVKYNLKLGTMVSIPGDGMFLGTKSEFATSYYSGLTDDADVLLTYEVDPKDVLNKSGTEMAVLLGKEQDSFMGGEFQVRRAKLIGVKKLGHKFESKQGAPLDSEGSELEGLGGKPVKTNPDGTITIYHRTTPAAAAIIRRTGRFKSQEENRVFASTSRTGQAESFGSEVIELKVRPSVVRLEDAFGDGEVHVSLLTRDAEKAFRAHESSGVVI